MEKVRNIKRSRLFGSNFLIPITIPIVGLLMVLFGFGGNNSEGMEFFFAFTLLGLIYGCIFWIPAIGVCLVIEGGLIQKKLADKDIVLITLAIEAGIASFILSYFIGGSFLDIPIALLVISICITQVLRWWFIVSSKAELSETEVENNSVLDDFEIGNN